MTAQVAILSTTGVAVASDSAVTITSARRSSRSYPSADKLYPVPGVPVAVLHSGCATLGEVPWKTLVELWASRRDPVELNSVEAYADEFGAWLLTQPQLADSESQDSLARWLFRDLMLVVRRRIVEDLEENGSRVAPGYVDGTPDAEIVDAVVDWWEDRLQNLEDYPGLSEEAGELIAKRLRDDLKEDLDWVFDDAPRTAHLDAVATEIAKLLIYKTEPFSIDSTLAFVGYGSDNLFPSLWRGRYCGILSDTVRVEPLSGATITPGMRVSITPLGLTDALDTFLRGTSPTYTNIAHHALEELAQKLGADADEGTSDVLSEAHQALEQEMNGVEWDEFLSPMLDVVETLPLTEMVRVADAFVGLASLRQMINGESSVGGPIDLARITKQSGFEWVRRKEDG